MWSPMGPCVQWDLSNVQVVTYVISCTVEPVQCGRLWDLMYSGTCLYNVITYGTSCTAEPVYILWRGKISQIRTENAFSQF